MKLARLLSIRTLFCFLAILGVIWFSPSQIFSADTPGATSAPAAPSVQSITLPAPTPAGGRTTTSLPPPGSGKPKEEKTLGQKAVETGGADFASFNRPNLITQGFVLTLMALLPFIVMILTSFMKIIIVLSLLRSALGVQQAPPNQIINGVAFMLSLFIMYPTVLKMYDSAQETVKGMETPESLTSRDASTYMLKIAQGASGPARDFLKANSSGKHQALFYRMAYRTLPESHREALTPSDFMILVPSFITSQLKDAFEIGVLIYIPFFVIDLVTSNILLAMGMMMLSPVTISMPLKLFLLVMLDGWTLLIEGLVATFH